MFLIPYKDRIKYIKYRIIKAGAEMCQALVQLVQLGKETGEQTKHLFQRLGILLMRGNSALILNRTPTHVEAEVDGDQDFDG